jgi:hypothetical protein
MPHLTGSLVAGVALVGVGLAGVIFWELSGAPNGSDMTPRRPRAPATAAAAHVPGNDHLPAWVASVLARPLFSPDRRPEPAGTPVTGAGLVGLPRLTAILVGPFGRSAIFAGQSREPIVVAEGGRIAAYQVTAIEATQVHLIGPRGAQVMQPSFDQGAAAQATGPKSGRAALPR